MDEGVAADPVLFTAMARGEDDLYLRRRQLANQGSRLRVNDLTVRARRDLTGCAAHLGAGDTL